MPRPTTLTAPSNGNGTRSAPSAARVPAPRLAVGRRRRVPWMVTGVLLVVGCALIFATSAIRLGGGRGVLVAARSLPVGHVIAAGDLRSVRVSSAGLSTVPAGAEAGLMGRPLALPVAAGSLLNPADLGAGSALSAGQAEVAVALKAGAYPPALAAGDQVLVVDTGAQTGTLGSAPPAGAGTSVSATVVAVDVPPANTSEAAAVVSLQVPADTAAGVVRLAAAGLVGLVLLPAGGAG
jgi:hypothetical protein